MATYLSPHSRHHQLRTYSNKENAPSPALSVFELTDIDAISTSLQTSLSGVTPGSSSSRPKKANGLGIGRAPKFTYRKHSSKPYNRDRVSSVQRAKKNVNRLPSSANPQKSKRGLRNRPTPLNLRERRAERNEEETSRMKITDRVRLDRWRKSVWKPSMARFKQDQLKLPFELPAPQIPPISIQDRYLANIPIDYIQARLRPMLPSIATVTLAYRPYSTVPHPDPTVPKGLTLPLAIPEIMNGDKSHWAARLKGREPDMVLAVHQKGAAEKEKMLVPVLSTVFAAQCAHWPGLTHQISTTTPSEPSTSSSSSSSSVASASSVAGYYRRTQSEAAVSQSLPAIIESSEDGSEIETETASDTERDPDSNSDTETEMDGSESSNTSWSSESEDDQLAIPPPVKDHMGFLHLPIVPFPLPSSATFGIIHRNLHHPSRSIVPDLLNLPEDQSSALESIVDVLRESPVQQLMEKIEIMHGVWNNLVCLGISDEKTWKELGQAWSCVLGIITGHAILNLDIPPEQIDGTKSTPKTLTEKIAWEWVREERAKMDTEGI
ncbi:uncharacterized protein I303_103981 [Kwoniella dejecticola CBS 10117]|uniref:Clampless protein 1 n=1 Tax=Kwoniella dejecticola CBS 10117 TaxID=1296121 RepID=A0A1A6A897_9TREE|nr:uncharacterized protein I303_03998 [Kwoniella dejecticola CBS 10117]OBR86276.1 hypothetical protein I303_03998 [Kwoniella dejecticola CBS 10117]